MSRRRRGDVGGSADEDGHGGAGGEGFDGEGAGRKEVAGEGGLYQSLNRLNIEFVSFRENLDTGGALGRAVVVIISAIAELELIIERVRAGMRRAKLEGRHIGRRPLDLDEASIRSDREHGHSLRKIANTYRISTATVCRVLRQEGATDAA